MQKKSRHHLSHSVKINTPASSTYESCDYSHPPLLKNACGVQHPCGGGGVTTQPQFHSIVLVEEEGEKILLKNCTRGSRGGTATKRGISFPCSRSNRRKAKQTSSRRRRPWWPFSPRRLSLPRLPPRSFFPCACLLLSVRQSIGKGQFDRQALSNVCVLTACVFAYFGASLKQR